MAEPDDRARAAAFLRAARGWLGRGQTELAAELGISRRTLTAMERGESPQVSLLNLRVVVEAVQRLAPHLGPADEMPMPRKGLKVQKVTLTRPTRADPPKPKSSTPARKPRRPA